MLKTQSITLFSIIIKLLLMASAQEMYCPTIGMSSNVLLTVSNEIDVDSFSTMLQFYAKMMPAEKIKYEFYFGANSSQIVTTDNLETEVDEWIHDADYLNQIYTASRADQDKIESIALLMIESTHKENQQDMSVFQKKQLVIISDYIPTLILSRLNSNQNENVQTLAIYHHINVTDYQSMTTFPVVSVQDVTRFQEYRDLFQKDLQFHFPKSVHEAHPTSSIIAYMTRFNQSSLINILNNSVNEPECSLSTNKMLENFIAIHFIMEENISSLKLPWLGDFTTKFNLNCINYYHKLLSNQDLSCSDTDEKLIQSYFDASTNPNLQTFNYLFVHNSTCFHISNNSQPTSDYQHVHLRVVLNDPLQQSYESLIQPLLTIDSLWSRQFDNQILANNDNYLGNWSTSCRDEMPMVPLMASRPWRRSKHLYIALDDMVVIVICATLSVATFGMLIYRHVHKKHRKQMELLSEIMIQPKIFKAPKVCPKVARLPWEIKSDMVHIDTEFLLGEGTISNVYLGKLKGKAPIMQWIDRVEMKQYQDCAVAVRVPRHFDEPEEDQLQREISSMRQLRHHDHIALFLGWTDKNNLVCSLLELTHMNLIKYLSQIRSNAQTKDSNGYSPFDRIPIQTLFKIVWETTDGIEYIHSKGLVHRDLTARNILLTTGLRAKISGFGFCSEPDDPKFSANSLALRYLPVRWLAPECFNGRFSYKSDSWAFAVLMYEMFTLGDQPYEDLLRPEEIIESVRKGRVPAHPKYASKQTYQIMLTCFEMFESRRPTFTQLKNAFHVHTSSYYHNPAFIGEEF